MRALRKRVLAKRAQAPTQDDLAEARSAGDDDAAHAVVGPRDQAASRSRGRGRTPGKRR